MTPFFEALLAGDRRAAAAAALQALDEGVAPLDFYADVVQPALHEIGRLWETNQINVAREHVATAIVEYVLGAMYARLPAVETSRGRAIVFGPAGERHQVGARIVADALEGDGWNVRFLGVGVPDEDVVAAVFDGDVALVGISAALHTRRQEVAELIRKIRFVGDAPRILVGGRAFNEPIARGIGADGYAPDVRKAVEVARG